jgi:hypothetical protein
MNIGSAGEDFGLMIVLLLPALLLPALLFFVSWLLAKLLRLPGIVTLLFGAALVAGALLAASFYLDSAGRLVTGRVDMHNEAIAINRQGDWEYDRRIELRYRLDGAPIAEVPSANESATSLRPASQQFDQLWAGGNVELRVLPLYRSLALVRLADTNTFDAIPWRIVAMFVGGLLLLWAVSRMLRSNVGGVIVVVLAVILGFGTPLVLGFQRGQASADLTARPLRATAEVVEVTRITEVDPFPCPNSGRSRCERHDTMFKVAQPYDIVQLRFTPQGAASPLVAVDAVDVDAARSYPPGESIEIAYAPADPRAALIPGSAHGHYLRNAVGLAGIIGGFTLLIAVLLFWGLWVARRKRSVSGHPVGSAQP